VSRCSGGPLTARYAGAVWAFVILAIAFFVAVGIMVGRIWAVLLPPAVWGLFYLGLQRGWWGAGVGDGWQYIMVFIILVSLAATVVGLVVRRVAIGPASANVKRTGSTRRTVDDRRGH
jgi:hypothetical protein